MLVSPLSQIFDLLGCWAGFFVPDWCDRAKGGVSWAAGRAAALWGQMTCVQHCVEDR